MDNPLTLAYIVIGAGLGSVIVYLHLEIKALKAEIARLRHTYATAAGLEDALAVLLDIQLRRAAETTRLDQALEILRSVRKGPYAYDQDKPAGRRPEGWDE